MRRHCLANSIPAPLSVGAPSNYAIDSIAAIERILPLHRKEIAHPHPEQAVHFGLQLIALALKEHIVPHASGEVAFSDDELVRELCRILPGYLGGKKKRPASRA